MGVSGCSMMRISASGLEMPIEQVLKVASKDEVAKQVIGSAIELLRQDLLRGKQLTELEALIAAEAVKVAAVVGSKFPSLVPQASGSPFVVVLPMTELHGLRKDCIVRENNELVHSSRRSISDEQMGFRTSIRRPWRRWGVFWSPMILINR